MCASLQHRPVVRSRATGAEIFGGRGREILAGPPVPPVPEDPGGPSLPTPVVIGGTAALFVALGLVAPSDRSGWVGSESATAASLPQPGKRGKAVRALQRRYHLEATGRMTKATDRALSKAVAAMTRPRTWYHSEVIGRSQSGRKITAYRAGEPGKPVVVVDGDHARRAGLRPVRDVRAAGGPPDQGHRPVGAAGGEPGRAGEGPAVGERTASTSTATSRTRG